jgi:hypothetical protein
MVLLVVAVLLPAVLLVTLTVFVCGPAGVDEGTLKVAVTVADWFIIRFPSEHVKFPLPVSEPLVKVQPLTDVRLKPLGHVSVSVTFCASPPVFVTVIVYVWLRPSPAVTDVVSAVLVTERLDAGGGVVAPFATVVSTGNTKKPFMATMCWTPFTGSTPKIN